MDELAYALDQALSDYNEMNPRMDLVLFQDAMKHVCRITRCLNNTAGHVLLVGVGGSGKQSLSKLSSHICGHTIISITITATYGINDLKADLQVMYMKAGVKQEGVVFLFTDNQIAQEKFLVYMNDLLNSGNIADLYVEKRDAVAAAADAAAAASSLRAAAAAATTTATTPAATTTTTPATPTATTN